MVELADTYKMGSGYFLNKISRDILDALNLEKGFLFKVSALTGADLALF